MQEKHFQGRQLAGWGSLLLGIWLLHFFAVEWLDPYFFTILMYAGINVILAVSLNLINGFTGQFSIGHAGFMSVGAYVSAFLTVSLQAAKPGFWAGNPALETAVFLGALLSGGLAAAGAGFVVGLPSLHLKGDYLAIVTLGFGEIIRVVLLNIEAVGGARGLPNIPALSSFGWVYTFVVVTVFVIWRVIHSRHGRECLAVREDEIAAEAMGVNATRTKVKVFVLGAFFAGIAGGLFGHFLRYVNPATFDFNRSFEIVIMVVLGGMGSITGSVVAALFLTFLREALRPLQELTRLDFRMVIYSLLLIILMLNRPYGIFGTRELPDVIRNLTKRFRPSPKLQNGGSS